LRLTTTGRRTHQQRSVILGWLNLQADPNARAELADGPRSVKVRAAAGPERARLWAKWREVEPTQDAHAALRSSETAVVVLEPRTESI
jgi:hypothetical protein